MQIDIKIAIEQNPNLKKYLKENSYWYRYLNRNGEYIKKMNEEMKKKYKLTSTDKLEKINNMTLVSEMLKILK